MTAEQSDDYEMIWLAPKCHENGGERTWARDNPWGDQCDDCEEKPVKFIRYDLHEQAIAAALAAEREHAVKVAKAFVIGIGGDGECVEAAIRAREGRIADLEHKLEQARTVRIEREVEAIQAGKRPALRASGRRG